MKQTFLWLALLLAGTRLLSQSTPISGVVNSYARVTAISGSQLSSPTPGLFAPGDLVLLIQMKGATINLANNSGFGDLTNYNNAGNYEFATVSAVNLTTVTLSAAVTGAYTPASGSVQLVRIPVYANATVTSTLTAQPWNGQTGGVLALKVDGTLTLLADVDATGAGFRGGNRSPINNLSPIFAFSSTSPQLGLKGESIADVSLSLTAQGKSANGGGGGHSHNAGGGGGSHLGAGGTGKSTPFAIFGSGPGFAGIGGIALNNNAGSRLFMGGGGGGGHQNDNHGQHGARGGGICIVSACHIEGNGFAIRANGANTLPDNSTNNDGGGGAGGGGSLLLQVSSLSGTLLTSANGGDTPAVCCGDGDSNHGAGGGGGGGFVWYAGASSLSGQTVSVAGGIGDRNAGEGMPGMQQGNWYVPLLSPSAPVAICQNATVYLDANGQASVDVTQVDGGSLINCGSLSLSPQVFSCANAGPNAVTLTAVNALGSSSCIATVNVVDALAPTVSCQDVTVALNAATGTVIVNPMQVLVASADNCALTLSLMPQVFTCADVGTQTALLTATDVSGNAATCTAQVTVTSDLAVSLDQNCVSITAGYGPPVMATLSATASGGSGSYTFQWSDGSSGQSVQVSPAVTTSYSVTVTDANGCIASDGTVQVIVVRVDNCHTSGRKILVCHVPPGNPGNMHEICIAPQAVPAHLSGGNGHGTCHLGPCVDPCSGSAKQLNSGSIPTAGVNISPNPSEGIFRIESVEGDFEFEVMTVQGQCIQKGASVDGAVEVNLSRETSGSYFVRVIGAGWMEVKKVIVN